jgi:hypothetical protein
MKITTVIYTEVKTKNSENSSISQLCFLSVIYFRFIITLVKGMFDLQIDKKKKKKKNSSINIMYISITKGLCTLITHINYFL